MNDKLPHPDTLTDEQIIKMMHDPSTLIRLIGSEYLEAYTKRLAVITGEELPERKRKDQ